MSFEWFFSITILDIYLSKSHHFFWGTSSCAASFACAESEILKPSTEPFLIWLSISISGIIHPWRLTKNIIMEVWKIMFLSKWVICRLHVNLPGIINLCDLWGTPVLYHSSPRPLDFQIITCSPTRRPWWECSRQSPQIGRKINHASILNPKKSILIQENQAFPLSKRTWQKKHTTFQILSKKWQKCNRNPLHQVSSRRYCKTTPRWHARHHNPGTGFFGEKSGVVLTFLGGRDYILRRPAKEEACVYVS